MGELGQRLVQQLAVHLRPARAGQRLHARHRRRRCIALRRLVLPAAAQRQVGLLRADLDLPLVHEADPPVQGMDLVVAHVRLNHDAAHPGQAEQIGHYRAHHREAETGEGALGRRDQQMHADIARPHGVAVADRVGRRVVALHQEAGFAAERAEVAGAAGRAVQFFIEVAHLLHRQGIHAPEAGMGLAGPAMQQRGVGRRRQRTQGEFPERIGTNEHGAPAQAEAARLDAGHRRLPNKAMKTTVVRAKPASATKKGICRLKAETIAPTAKEASSTPTF